MPNSLKMKPIFKNVLLTRFFATNTISAMMPPRIAVIRKMPNHACGPDHRADRAHKLHIARAHGVQCVKKQVDAERQQESLEREPQARPTPRSGQMRQNQAGSQQPLTVSQLGMRR